jgi:dCTP deaminase
MIKTAIARDEIVIRPLDLKCLGTNSYDVHLSPHIKLYAPQPDPKWVPRLRCPGCLALFEDNQFAFTSHASYCPKHKYERAIADRVEVHVDDPTRVRPREQTVIDARRDNHTITRTIGPDGMILSPNHLYLGSTIEYTESHKHVPFVDGKSSSGRLGITIHCTAGRGDVGFKGHWTLEIHVVEAVRVYAGMPIGQLIFFETGEVDMPYDKKPNAKYGNNSPEPQASMMFRNFE